VCIERFPRGVPGGGGAGMPPPGYAQRSTRVGGSPGQRFFFLGGFLLFLADL
jgi:hypothetical protein